MIWDRNCAIHSNFWICLDKHTMPTYQPARKRNILRKACYVSAINSLVAVFITFGLHNGETLWTNWVFSMLIGTSITLVIDRLSAQIWKNTEPHKGAYLFVCICATPLGFYLGYALGLLFFGLPFKDSLVAVLLGGNKLLIMSIVISMIAGLVFLNQTTVAELKAQAEQEKTRSAIIERQALQAQLQLLQAQIEPHMLFNTLSNLQGLIKLDPDRAQYMLDQLIIYLRATLQASRTEKISLKEEFTLVRAYLELLSIRMGKRLRYTLDLAESVQSLEIVPMLIQPLVENALKHGLEPKIGGGEIHVTAQRVADFLCIKVVDTGLGLTENDQPNANATSGTGLGNANIAARLLAAYGNLATFTLTPNQAAGVTAQISIPL